MSFAPNIPIRAVLIDDHPIVRFGIETALLQLPGYEIAGHAATAEEAISLVESSQPTLLTLDLVLEGKAEPNLIPRLKALCPGMHILIFTMSDEAIFAQKMLNAGASGYLMKSDGLIELKIAAQKILSGEVYISNRLQVKLKTVAERKNDKPILSHLSQRELEIFQHLGAGKTTSEIARELNLSVKTVAAHRDNLKLKLKASTSIELVQKAVSCSFGRII